MLFRACLFLHIWKFRFPLLAPSSFLRGHHFLHNQNAVNVFHGFALLEWMYRPKPRHPPERGSIRVIDRLSSTKISLSKTSHVAVLLLILFYLKKPEYRPAWKSGATLWGGWTNLRAFHFAA